jgi:ADP-ribosylglycohydrolase
MSDKRRLDRATRLALARDSLDGLSVGDALGEAYFASARHLDELAAGHTPAAPWPWTDDTEMASSIVAELADLDPSGAIDQDRLARAFAGRCQPERGYGPGAVILLQRIRDGADWRTESRAMFGGRGSLGNGGAMRVAPLGAYFADDPAAAAREAARTAEVTHLHLEGIAGAVAVAVAAAYAAGGRLAGRRPEPLELLDTAFAAVPDSAVRDGIGRARRLLGCQVAEAAAELGNGAQIIAPDTVPFTLWAAATYLHDYPAGIVACVTARGDTDTTAAIVGGIVAGHTGVEGERDDVTGVPMPWLAARERLPSWLPLPPND